MQSLLTRLLLGGGGGFSPAALFSSGAEGVWYDPSDSATLFSDTAGTTPCAAPGAGALVNVGRMLDKSGRGNHAISYNSTTARPELSARVNLLTNTEWLGAVAGSPGTPPTSWSFVLSTGSISSVNQAQITFTVSSSRLVLGQNINYSANTVYRMTFTVHANSGLAANNIFSYNQAIAGATESFFVNGVSQAVNTYQPVPGDALEYLLTVGATAGSSTIRLGAGCAGNATGVVTLSQPDMRPTNIGANVPVYQRIADQYTYDTVGFPRYLRFDGVDDGMSTPANLNLSATDKATVFAGVRKLSDAAMGVVAELSVAASASYPGSFNIFAPNSAAATNYGFRSGGSLSVGINSGGGTYASPITNVLALNTDIGNDVLIGRINGAQVNNSTSDQGTGNFGTYPLYIGARNNASLWFNGYLYSLIVVGAAATAAQISSTESWIAGKEGITL